MEKFFVQVKNTIEKYGMLAKGDKVLVGVSGGPDSVALLHILKALREEYSLELFVVHVNHMFRGEEARKEAQFVGDLATSWGIDHQIFTEDVGKFARDNRLSPQDAGHQIRKQIFQKLKEKKGFTKLALGHHSGDRVETLLIHLIQGTGLEGLAAMAPRDQWLIRPLASVKKEDIISYCQSYGLTYCLDPSNAKDIYLRNKVRLNLLPYLEREFNPNITETLLKLESIVAEENRYMEEKVKGIEGEVLKKPSKGKIEIDLKRFNDEPLAIKRRLVRSIFHSLRPESQGLSFNNTEQVIEMVLANKGHKELNLPLGIQVAKGYTTIEFIDTENVEDTKIEQFHYSWELPGELFIPQLNILLEGYYTWERPPTPPHFSRVVLDGDKISSRLEVRSRQKGDRFQPVGMEGTKKLKDFYIDRKIARDLREVIPVILSGEEIIWLPGIAISEKVKIQPSTKEYLVLEGKRVNMFEKKGVLW